jgi:hypothetical protein
MINIDRRVLHFKNFEECPSLKSTTTQRLLSKTVSSQVKGFVSNISYLHTCGGACGRKGRSRGEKGKEGKDLLHHGGKYESCLDIGDMERCDVRPLQREDIFKQLRKSIESVGEQFNQFGKIQRRYCRTRLSEESRTSGILDFVASKKKTS